MTASLECPDWRHEKHHFLIHDAPPIALCKAFLPAHSATAWHSHSHPSLVLPLTTTTATNNLPDSCNPSETITAPIAVTNGIPFPMHCTPASPYCHRYEAHHRGPLFLVAELAASVRPAGRPAPPMRATVRASAAFEPLLPDCSFATAARLRLPRESCARVCTQPTAPGDELAARVVCLLHGAPLSAVRVEAPDGVEVVEVEHEADGHPVSAFVLCGFENGHEAWSEVSGVAEEEVGVVVMDLFRGQEGGEGRGIQTTGEG